MANKETLFPFELGNKILILLGFFAVAVLGLGLWLHIGSLFLIILSGCMIIFGLTVLFLLHEENSSQAKRNIDLNNQINDLKKQLSNNVAVHDQKTQEQMKSVNFQKGVLEMTLSGIDDGIIVVNQNKQIVIFNKAASNFTGLTDAEVIGKPIDAALKIFDQTNELTFAHYCPVKPADFEGLIYQKQGLKMVGRKEIFVDFFSTQIKSNSYLGIGCIITLKDVTREKQLESMKLDFVSMAAHELRTPLTSIKGYLSVFLEENKEKLDASGKTLLDSLSNATEQLSSLVENLLSVTRIERGVLEINLEKVDYPKFVKEMVDTLKPKSTDKQIQLEFIQPAPGIPPVKMDKLRITEVVANLINNAINYTEPGGSIKVNIVFQGKEVITSVADNGHGIPKEAQDHLFNKFYRVSNALGTGIKGTGLGLYITKSIIDIHHGRIWVESEPGKGSTFFFALPAS